MLDAILGPLRGPSRHKAAPTGDHSSLQRRHKLVTLQVQRAAKDSAVRERPRAAMGRKAALVICDARLQSWGRCAAHRGTRPLQQGIRQAFRGRTRWLLCRFSAQLKIAQYVWASPGAGPAAMGRAVGPVICDAGLQSWGRCAAHRGTRPLPHVLRYLQLRAEPAE